MASKYAAMLAAAVGVALGGDIAMAQTAAIPVANLPKQCQEMARKGFNIKHETIQRSGTAGAMVATQARAGSNTAPRKYGEGGDNKWFVDSFPSHPKEGCRVCGVFVAVKGNVSQNSSNNDSIALIGSSSAAPQYTNNAVTAAHTRLGGAGPLTNGPYSSGFMIEGPAWMAWYMNALVPSFDIAVQDDTTINTIEVTYFYY